MARPALSEFPLTNVSELLRLPPSFSEKRSDFLYSVQAVAFRELFVYVHVYALFVFLCRSIPRLDLHQDSIKERNVA